MELKENKNSSWTELPVLAVVARLRPVCVIHRTLIT